MNILQVVRPAQGGQRRHVQALIKGLLEHGDRVALAGALDQAWLQWSTLHQIQAFPLPLVAGLRPWHDVQASVQLRRVLAEVRPGLIHVHGAKAALVASLSGISVGAVPYVYTVHGFPNRETLPDRLLRRGESAFARRAAAVVAVSKSLGSWTRHALKVPSERVHVIYHGVDLARLEESARDPRVEGESVGTVARLSPEKGVDLLIRAWPSIVASRPRARLYIVGEGHELQPLRTLAGRCGVADTIHFLGGDVTPGALYKALQLYVQPSRREGFGLAALEAMAMGCPVVGCRVGGLPEVLGEGRGLLCEPEPRDLAEACLRVLEDHEMARALSVAGREFARGISEVEQIAAIRALYEGLV